MIEHERIAQLLPTYVSGALDEADRQQVQAHLDDCAECQSDLALWQATAAEVIASDRAIVPPPGLLAGALERIHTEADAPVVRRRSLLWLRQLLGVQALLVRREIWPASAAVMLLGFVAALLAEQTQAFQVIAPLVAAACMAIIYGPENDPATELAMATPTSPRQILLARFFLVFGYNLTLALAVSLAMLPLLSVPLFGELVLGWLVPMTFLSALALVLSLWIGSGNAITLSYLGWLAQYALGGLMDAQAKMQPASPFLLALIDGYLGFWGNTGALLAVAVVLFGTALWLAGRQEHRLQHAL